MNPRTTFDNQSKWDNSKLLDNGWNQANWTWINSSWNSLPISVQKPSIKKGEKRGFSPLDKHILRGKFTHSKHTQQVRTHPRTVCKSQVTQWQIKTRSSLFLSEYSQLPSWKNKHPNHLLLHAAASCCSAVSICKTSTHSAPKMIMSWTFWLLHDLCVCVCVYLSHMYIYS
jgi:hypothetical protein